MSSAGLLREFASFLRDHKLWWILPLVLLLASAIAIAVIASQPDASFIYSPF
jgi:hypothetical protein